MPDESLVYYHTDDGAGPATTRYPWTATGGGSETVDKQTGVTITASTAARYWTRPVFDTDSAGSVRVEDRIEVELRFQGATTTPGGTWASGSAHLIVIDDGERAVGLSIGDTLQLVDPSNGDVLLEISESWGWLALRTYRLIKRGSTSWDVFSDGRLVGRMAYVAGAASFLSVPSTGWGWWDATGSGVGTWQEVESGLNTVLPPNWMVERYQVNMPALVQQAWNARWRALLRSLVGTTEALMDEGRGLWESFGAGWFDHESMSFEGTHLPDQVGWTLVDDTPTVFSVSSEKIRIAADPDGAHYAEFTFTEPPNTEDGFIYAHARFRVIDHVSTNPLGRLGPFIELVDGQRRILAYMLFNPANPEDIGWQLLDGSLADGALSVALGSGQGEVLMRVDPSEEVFVELFMIKDDRILLFINDRLVEDLPYDNFSGAVAGADSIPNEEAVDFIPYAIATGAPQNPVAQSGFNNFSTSDYFNIEPDYAPGGYNFRTFLIHYTSPASLSADQTMMDRLSTSLGGLILEMDTTGKMQVFGYTSVGGIGGAFFDAGHTLGNEWWMFVTVLLGTAVGTHIWLEAFLDANVGTTADAGSVGGAVSTGVSFNQEMYIGRNQAGTLSADELDIHAVAMWNRQLTGAEQLDVRKNLDRYTTDVVWWYGGSGEASWSARIGRDGAPDFESDTDVWDAHAAVGFADNTYRGLFQQRVAERLVFASGCERNDRLDVWLRHRHGVFKARGTALALSEVRRLACDDAAQAILSREPADWYLEVSYPEVTPIFLEAAGDIGTLSYEVQALAPYFTAAELDALLEEYILPRSVIEAKTRVLITTLLTTATVNAATTTFNVASLSGFEVGDPVTLRGVSSGSLLSLQYDTGLGRTDVTVRDFGAWDEDGEGSAGGTTSDLTHTGDNEARWVPDGPASFEGIETQTTVTPVITGGFTFMARLTPGKAHDGAQYVICDMDNGIGTGGFFAEWSAAGNFDIAIYNAGAGFSVSAGAWDPGAGVTSHLAVVYRPAANELGVYIDGVQLNTGDTSAFTPLDPGGAGTMSFAARNDSDADEFPGSISDVWWLEYALSDAQVAAHEAGSRVDAPRNVRWDPVAANRPRLCYLPAGYSVAMARYEVDTLQADFLEVKSFRNDVWGEFQVRVDGYATRENLGSIAVTGLGTDKLANIGGGQTVDVVPASAAAVGLVTLYGISQTTGLGAVEHLVLDGSGDTVTGVQTWQANGLHGASINVPAGDAIDINQTAGATLFTIPAAGQAEGVHVFDPALRAGPSTLDIVVSTATATDLLVFGHEEGAGEGFEEITTAGTTAVTTTIALEAIHALAVPNHPNTDTLTFTGRLSDPTGQVHLVSDNAADVMAARVVVLDTSTGLAGIEVVTLTGVTKVSGLLNAGRILGIELLVEAVGTITVTIEDGAQTIDVGTIAPTLDSLGARRLLLDCTGTVRLTLSKAPSSRAWVAVWGLDESTGLLAVELVEMTGVTEYETTMDFRGLYGIGTAQLDEDTWVLVEGIVWRHHGPREAASALADSPAWAASTLATGFDPELDGDLGKDLSEDVARVFSGDVSVTEDTTISALDSATNLVTTPVLTNSFAIDDRMRERT